MPSYSGTAGRQLETYYLPKIERILLALGKDREEARPAGGRRAAITATRNPGLLPDKSSEEPPAWRHGTIEDPVLRKLEQLAALIKQLAAMPESRESIPRLNGLAQGAVKAAEELANVHQLAGLRVAAEEGGAITFQEALQALKRVGRYYSRLAFYMTPEGVSYLHQVISSRSVGNGNDMRMQVHPHRIVENIAPDAHEDWKMRDWEEWYLKNVKDGVDPLSRMTDFLLTQGLHLLINDTASKARLALDEDYRDVNLVRIRNGIAGDPDYPPGPLARIWTFRVKTVVAVGQDNLVKWETPTSETRNAISLPVLRPVHSGSTDYRHVGCDFTRGSIYAMDGPEKMYCLPATKHHSALMSGEPISAAGILVANEGRVVAIDNRSGHYQPSFRHLLNAVKYLSANRVMEDDAFVALYLSEENALYLSPSEFIQAANANFGFAVTSRMVAERAARFGNGLPVAARHAELIPTKLRDFPVHGAVNRWDFMLSELYSVKGADLASIVARLKGILQQDATAPSPGGWSAAAVTEASSPAPAKWLPSHAGQSRGTGQTTQNAVANYLQMVNATLHSLSAGGAYMHLLWLLDRLITAGAALTGTGQPERGSVSNFRRLRSEANALRPAATIL